MNAGPRITRISFAPVKGMRLLSLEETELTRYGIPGDRAFYVVDSRRRMVNAKRIGKLLTIVPRHDREAGVLGLEFPDGSTCEDRVRLGEPAAFTFFGMQVQAKPVEGPFSEAISRHVGENLRLVVRPEDRPAVDRGAVAGITLLGSASVTRLEEVAAVAGPAAPAPAGAIDCRRFRMSVEFDGTGPHEEDGWIGRKVKAGGATLQVNGHVGRCAVTTRNPDSSERDLPVLRLLREYRSDEITEESLPFGVYAAVREPGLIRVGDPIGTL